jgi:hypothetical protein
MAQGSRRRCAVSWVGAWRGSSSVVCSPSTSKKLRSSSVTCSPMLRSIGGSRDSADPLPASAAASCSRRGGDGRSLWSRIFPRSSRGTAGLHRIREKLAGARHPRSRLARDSNRRCDGHQLPAQRAASLRALRRLSSRRQPARAAAEHHASSVPAPRAARRFRALVGDGGSAGVGGRAVAESAAE